MSLAIGHKLGHYEILEPIGRGGMGEVYQAKDTKLGRDVAIKVLPDEFAQDEERLRRFQREAKVLASLNHPNIASIYGLEQSGETQYLVLELVPGETLADRIARGPMPVDEALEIAGAIAEALEEAHERGIVHRDLKPANVKLTEDGKIKVLDFGLAKAFAEETAKADSSMSPTITRDATRVGVILGTPSYMSPEQAKGKCVDRRADIFAFGAVLYEMFTGKKAFPGEDVSEVLAAVINLQPDWDRAPARLRALLRRCLEKDPKRRYRDIGDVRLDLVEPLGVEEAVTGLPWRYAVAALAATVVLTGLVVRSFSQNHSESGRDVRRFTIVEPVARPASNERPLALSPDGRVLTFVSEDRSGIALRYLDRFETTLVPDSAGAHQLFASPDGESLGFYADGSLKRVTLDGGDVTTLVRDAPFGGGASWGNEGRIVLGTLSGLAWVSASGGVVEPLTSLEGEEMGAHRWPDILPGSQWVLFTVSRGRGRSQVEAVSFASRERKVVMDDATAGRYSPSGHLIFWRGRVVYAAPFDAIRAKTTGQAVPVLEGVHVSGAGAAILAISEDGTLAFYPTETHSAPELTWVAQNGQTESIISSTSLNQPRLSPEERRIALGIRDETGTNDVWIYDVERETRTRITFDGRSSHPVWMPDGASLIYTTSGETNQLFRKRADGSGAPEPLLEMLLGGYPSGSSVLPDGSVLGFTYRFGGPDWGFLELDGEKEPTIFIDPETEEADPAFAPNGRWVAYASTESGTSEIYVRDFPGPGGKWQVSIDGGEEPLWSKDGKELFFRDGSRMMSVAIEGDPFPFGQPKHLFDAYQPPPNSTTRTYDVASDGRFLMLRGAGEEMPTEIHIVLNWFEELERLVPTDN